MHRTRTSRLRTGPLVASVLLLLTVLAIIPGSATAATPPLLQNDCGTGGDAGASHAAATALALPKVNCSGDLFTSLDPQDWYRFPVNTGDLISASMTPAAGSNFDLCLYTPSGVSVACSSNPGSTTESFSYTATATGDWRLAVIIVTIPGDTYTLSASAVTPQNDCGTGGDAGDTHATASTISLPKSRCAATLVAVTDTEDWYQFAVTSGHSVVARAIAVSAGTLDLCLFNPSGSQVGSCTASGATIEQVATTAGSWRLRVRFLSGTTVSHDVTVGTSPPNNDCGTGGDAAETHSSAALITLPKTNCAAALAPVADDSDYYQFAVTAGQNIHATVTPNAAADYLVCLSTPSGAAAGSCARGQYGTMRLISYAAGVTGNWRLRVSVSGGTGSYTMSVWNTTPNDDCGLGVDAGPGSVTATAVALPKTNCVGYVNESTDDEDWYKFNVTAGETIRVSVLPDPDGGAFPCLEDPNGFRIDDPLCGIATTGRASTKLHTATVSGDWRVRIETCCQPPSGGAYLLSISKKAGSPSTVRDDDNELDTFADLRDGNDAATKRLVLSSAQLTGATSATLFVNAKAYGLADGERFRLRANNVPIDEIDPRGTWSTSQYTWAEFSVPLSALVAGTNSFSLSDVSGKDLTSGVQLGVDLDLDFGRSDITVNGSGIGGELMWYLVVL